MIPLVWVACDCTCWPISPLFGVSRCGWCRKRPTKPCENLYGTAYALSRSDDTQPLAITGQ